MRFLIGLWLVVALLYLVTGCAQVTIEQSDVVICVDNADQIEVHTNYLRK